MGDVEGGCKGNGVQVSYQTSGTTCREPHVRNWPLVGHLMSLETAQLYRQVRSKDTPNGL